MNASETYPMEVLQEYPAITANVIDAAWRLVEPFLLMPRADLSALGILEAVERLDVAFDLLHGLMPEDVVDGE